MKEEDYKFGGIVDTDSWRGEADNMYSEQAALLIDLQRMRDGFDAIIRTLEKLTKELK